jgi:hypothetical protein
MEPTLRGVPLPAPRFRTAPLPEKLRHVNGFRGLQTYFPALSKLFHVTKHQANTIWLDSNLRIAAIDISGTSGLCHVDLVNNVDVSGVSEHPVVKTCPAFLKVTHLLDPVRWMKGVYSFPKEAGLPWHSKTWAAAWTKLQDQSNQAYVETIAAYALGRIRDANLSPHFNQFYGAFCARANRYRYNLTEEFRSLRNTRWFWHGQKRNLYKLHIDSVKEEEVSKEVLDELLREPDSSDSDSEEEVNVEITAMEEASLHSDKMSDLSYAETTATESTEMEEEYRIYAEITDFPVMMIALENNEGTMDSLLDDYTQVGSTPGTDEWELKWSAWIFQVIAALSAAQTLIGFTHNDLHTNNIVWSPTEEEYFYYTKRSGETFRVPTYGKLFRIIDFGRAIFTINSNQFISDDFKAGNDADGQYAFKPLHMRSKQEILPNPSFDLCRLSVSLFEALFPEAPEDKVEGAILSSEEDLEVIETVSPLYNVLWSWLIDDEGRNVLITPSGDERFPDFDLYKHVAAHVHTAVPARQFLHPAFGRFLVDPSEVGSVKKWSLFV